MKLRPVRPNIYLPVVRFGVADSDWFSVLLISCAGYLVPVPLGITLLYVPLQMWTWLLATVGSIALFNYIRIGRRPYWLQHKLKSIGLHDRQYPALPNGKKRPFKHSWLIAPKGSGTGNVDDEQSDQSLPARRLQTALVMDHNYQLQEACNEQWNPLWLTTNSLRRKSHAGEQPC
jgi:hypothetical protein